MMRNFLFCSRSLNGLSLPLFIGLNLLLLQDLLFCPLGPLPFLPADLLDLLYPLAFLLQDPLFKLVR